MGATVNYEGDVVAWAREQVALMKAGRFSELDLENVIEEIDDVAKRERRELKSRMAILIAHLLKHKYQPEKLTPSWAATVRIQRRSIAALLDQMPSLKPVLHDTAWFGGAYDDGLLVAIQETQLETFPSVCEWTVAEILGDLAA